MREIKFRAWNDIDKTMCDNGVVLHRLSALTKIKSYHVMQFTGLTDKNGVEIYEGDILKLDDLTVAVTFNDGSFQIKTNDYQGASQLMQMRAGRFAVVGNIYQNPELVKL